MERPGDFRDILSAMFRLVLWTSCVFLAACGRSGFDPPELEDVANDAVGDVWVVDDPASPRRVFRSVGPGSIEALATGSDGATLTLVSGVATFSTPLPPHTGVGDALLMDRNGGGDLDAGDEVAFIISRDPTAESTVFAVRTVGGERPANLGATAVWELYRAYTSTADAEAGRENPGIPAELRDFDTWVDGRDLPASDQQWNISVYGDAPDTGFRLRDWISSPAHYLRIFAPGEPDEVGESQRHAGVWDATKTRFINADYFGTINNENETTPLNHVRLDGLQVENTRTVQPGNGGGINFDDFDQGPLSDGELIIANCLIRKTVDNWSGVEQAGIWVNGPRLARIVLYNNIVMGFSRGIAQSTPEDIELQIFNNTVVDSLDYGIQLNGYAAVEHFRVKNNLVVGSGVRDYTFSSSLSDTDFSHNLSSDDSALGSDSVLNAGITFVSAATGNYNLGPGDTDATDAGTDLSSGPYTTFNTDAAGRHRDRWDVGALAFE